VFNFAIHGTSFGADNLHFSPDNMGYAQEGIESGNGGLALFFNGSEGDVSPKGDPSAIGDRLAEAVLATRESIVTSPEVALRSDFCQLDDRNVSPDYGSRACPGNLEPFRLCPLKYVEDPRREGCYLSRNECRWPITIAKGEDPPYVEREGVVLAAFRIDTPDANAVVLTIPGEPITEVGDDLKLAARELGYDLAWVFSLTNGLMGYIASEREYNEGGYEGASNMWGASAAEVFTGISIELARRTRLEDADRR
jgi:hypothetical protein